MSGVDKGMQFEPGEPNEPLHDEALRKALAQAPDRSTLPDWRVRQAILDHAHDAISASEELLTASRERAPWWRLAWWRNKVGLSGATPWNAVLASLMVAVLVTLVWEREPVPGPRLDDQAAMTAAPVSPAPAPVPAPAAAPLVKDEAAKEAAPKEAAAKEAASKEAAAKEAAAKEAATREAAAKEAAVKAAAAKEAAAREAAAKKAASAKPAPAAPATSEREPKPESAPAAAAPARTPGAAQEPMAGVDSASRPSTESFAAAPTPPARATPSAPPAADALAERRKSAPAAAAPPLAQLAPAPDTNRAAGQGNPRQPVPAPAAAAPSARTESMPMSDFASLSRWTELRVANVNGDVRVVPRAEAGDLGLLLSSAAIMAVGATPLRSLPEWRVSLERRGQVLAVLEVARSDVRWTEGGLPPAAGTPPPEALEALRGALRQAIRAGAPARAMPALPPAKAPEAGESSGRLPYSPLAPPAPPAIDTPAPVTPPGSGASPAQSPRPPG